jgi:hypothetical protein
MLGWDDTETTIAIREEFFEALEHDRTTEDLILATMPPTLRREYEAWAESALGK